MTVTGHGRLSMPAPHPLGRDRDRSRSAPELGEDRHLGASLPPTVTVIDRDRDRDRDHDRDRDRDPTVTVTVTVTVTGRDPARPAPELGEDRHLGAPLRGLLEQVLPGRGLPAAAGMNIIYTIL